jgi:hypothetical protein
MNLVIAWSEEINELTELIPRPINEWPGHWQELYQNVAGLASRISELQIKIETMQTIELELKKAKAEREKLREWRLKELNKIEAEKVLGLEKAKAGLKEMELELEKARFQVYQLTLDRECRSKSLRIRTAEDVGSTVVHEALCDIEAFTAFQLQPQQLTTKQLAGIKTLAKDVSNKELSESGLKSKDQIRKFYNSLFLSLKSKLIEANVKVGTSVVI